MMVTKKQWEKPILEFLELLRSTKDAQQVEISGRPFVVLPGVFSPVYSTDTAWFAEKVVPLVEGKTFLEIGAGTGIIACLAALGRSREVVATDINSQAIENIHANAAAYRLKITTKVGSVYTPLQAEEAFDLIFWNHPFYYAEPTDAPEEILSLSVMDVRYQALQQFFAEGKKHLRPGGQLLLGTSNIARIKLIKQLAHTYGYGGTLLHTVVLPVYQGQSLQMDLRLYSFTS